MLVPSSFPRGVPLAWSPGGRGNVRVFTTLPGRSDRASLRQDGDIVEHWVGIWRRYWMGAWWSILDGNMAEGIGWQYGMVEEHCQTKLTIILFDNNVWIWE